MKNNLLARLLEPKSNGHVVAKLLIDLLNVKISGSTLKKEIEEHPDYPSLLSVSDVLDRYGVENVGIKFQTDSFDKLPTPFITQIIIGEHHANFFTVVKENKKTDTVTFWEPEKNVWKDVPKKDFISQCTGVALLAEANYNAGERDYIKAVNAEKSAHFAQLLMIFCIPSIVAIACVVSLIQSGILVIYPILYALLTLAGCVIGTLLFWYELDRHNPILQKICKAGMKVNCGAILQSKAAKIGGLSWSVIGFSYFIGLLFILLFGGIANQKILFISAWLSTLALPYVMFSIYYQWLVARQWCMLCLCVQGILILQFGICLIAGWHIANQLNNITLSLVVPILLAFTLPLLITSILLPALRKSKEGKRVNAELQKLKHNTQIFEALLHRQKAVIENPDGLGIVLGNPEATYKLIKVCNPYCGPCADAHKPIEDLLENNPDVQVQMLFTATNAPDDEKAPPVKHFLALAEKFDEKSLKAALDDWYSNENKDYEVFASKYLLNGELENQHDRIEAMKTWCQKIKIEYTPTFFIGIPDPETGKINKYFQMPDLYTVADLKYFFSV